MKLSHELVSIVNHHITMGETEANDLGTTLLRIIAELNHLEHWTEQPGWELLCVVADHLNTGSA